LIKGGLREEDMALALIYQEKKMGTYNAFV